MSALPRAGPLRAIEEFLEIFFPPACAACGRVLPVRGALCLRCELDSQRIPEQRCRRCAEPGDFPKELCPRCRIRPPDFERAVAPFAHEGPIARAIHRFKYEDHPELAPQLTELLLPAAAAWMEGAIPTACAIPLHALRFRKRKYDQAQLLARELAGRLGIPFAPQCLRRVRETQRQVGLHEDERERNLAGAFAATSSPKRVLLIDDVLTTGATARAASAALRGAGAKEVRVLTIARALSR